MPARLPINYKELTFQIVLLILGTIIIWPTWREPENVNVFSAPLVPAVVSMGKTVVFFSEEVLILGLINLSLLLLPLVWYRFLKTIALNNLVSYVGGLLLVLPIKFMGLSRTEAVYSWGDGAHIFALLFFPYACSYWFKFLKYGEFKFGLYAALGIALVALTSPFGLISLVFFLAILLFSEMLLGNGRVKALRGIFISVLAAGLTAWWYHPSFVASVLQTDAGQDFVATVGNLVPISFVVVPVLGTFGFLLFEKRHHLQPLFIGIFLSAAFIVIAFARNVGGAIGGQQFRYLPELGIALGTLWAVMVPHMIQAIGVYSNFLPPRLKAWGRQPRTKWLFLLILLCVWAFVFNSGLQRLWTEYADWRITPQSLEGHTTATGMWAIRNQAETIDYIGYAITFGTIGVLFWLQRILRGVSITRNSNVNG